ncbi:MAG: photosystem II oxygen evolving complex protein PsbP [Symploca sp. SIO3C6]|uniref:Photosystem II oxygen evolving complex protein PsbP n=1 Tax=Symploca sp. SIO1C4 TaxID=2607765 RepID=A0A6B3N784_9CYAN|nr:photosystem II oxygen evolving complex protein PsbP [Symploca sp. SIO3C6]NER26685.1 photosystem II oxygen evolving complex protein PsbP [Symploca sp. SIO1C4]NET07594.1 photosystem II oxygen evolving complex protein PsbP [Symploca sp. SIO2B6]
MLSKIAPLALLVLSLVLHGCAAGEGGLQNYIDSIDGYEFMYPNGWLPVQVTDGPDVVFHDLIERTENVSVVISPVSEGKALADLGTPGEVGYQLQKNAIAPPGSNRQAELINAEAIESGGKSYYILEYSVKLPNAERHDIASVATSRGKLFTLNVSTTEQRWSRVHELFEQVVKSFSVY